MPDQIHASDSPETLTPPASLDALAEGVTAQSLDLSALASLTDSPLTALLGKTIKNRYTLWEMIGAGLQAQAYLAYDNLLEGKVVVKVLSNEIEGIPLPLAEDWEQEAKKAMQVRNCPYIASVTDFGQENLEVDDAPRDVAYIVWEYVKGETLQELIEDARELSLEFLIELAQQLMQVLHILQATNLIHGDLHSKNILVDRESSGKPLIKVIDFGLSHQGETGRNAYRDFRSAHRLLTHLIARRKEQLGAARFTERDQEFAAIVAQLGIEDANRGEVLQRTKDALNSLARRHFANTPSIGEYETIDQVFPWSQTILAQVGIARQVPLIGRQELVQQIQGHLEHTFAEGHGAILLLKGESGVGKKRVLWEALHGFCLMHREVFLFTARGHRGSEQQAFASLREMLRAFLGEEREDDYARLLGMLLPDSQPLIGPLTEFLSDERPGSPKTSDLPAGALAHLVAKALSKISLLRPLILWVSDLQYVDEASRQCLLQAARDAERFPLLCLGSYTPGDLAGTSGQQALFDEWHSRISALDGYREIAVRSLQRPQVAEFLRVALPWPALPETHVLVNALWQHSGGNPHFLQESLAYLRQSGILEENTDGSWEVDTGALQDVGATSIQLLLERRVQHLEPRVREVLDAAACWGVEFPESGVLRLCEAPPEETRAALFNATEQGLLMPLRTDMLTFQPYALWELLDAALTADRKQRYHRGIADVLQQGVEQTTGFETPLAIAKHWEAGGESQRALDFYLLAAEKALSIRANEQALEACRRAQSLLGSGAFNSLEAAQLTTLCYLHQAKAYRYLGDQAAQEEYAVKAFEGAVIARDERLELRALKAIGEYYRGESDYECSTDYFRRGMDIAETLGDRARLARFHKEIGVNFYLLGDMVAAEGEYQHAIRINSELGDAEGLARVSNNLGMISRNRGEWQQAKQWFEKAIAYFQEAGETRGVVLPMGNMAIIYTEEGEYEKAMILLKELLKEEAKIGESRLQAKIRVSLGDVQNEIGEFEDALTNYEHSLTVYRALGDRQGECEVLTNIASVYYEQGKADRAEHFHRMALELKQEIGYEWGIPLDYYDLARVSIDREVYEEGLALIEQGLEVARRLRMHGLEFSLEVLALRALEEQGQSPAKQLAKRYDHLVELYPQVQGSVMKQHQLQFLVQASRFYQSQNEPMGERLLLEARALLKKLASRLFRPERRARFWEKYHALFPDLAPPTG